MSHPQYATGAHSTSISFSGSAKTDVAQNATTLVTRKLQMNTLSARAAVTVATNSLTVTPKWEVSDDQSTYYAVKNPSNAAWTVLATGNGTGATTNHVLTAPSAVYGWRFCRVALTPAAATGTSADVATVTYNYVQRSGFEYL